MTAAERFGQIEALGEDWDSYGAHPIDVEVIDHARHIAVFLVGIGLPVAPVPCSDGSISLEISGDRYEVNVYIKPKARSDGA